MRAKLILALATMSVAALSTTVVAANPGAASGASTHDHAKGCERSFEAAVEDYRVTTFEKDADGFNALLADDVTVVLAEGTTLVGKKASADFVEAFFGNPAWTQTLDVVRTVKHRCQTAFVLFDSVLTMTPGGTPEPLAIGVTFVRERGQWLVLHNQDSTGPVAS
ncbi:YybH family protein [Nocardioides sp. LHG3406-4]|uniref:YybH family protein n=1 Tax=Nocardioides sp. LHG3406-4 TaxID=2804575 RepID=UPI003CF21777